MVGTGIFGSVVTGTIGYYFHTSAMKKQSNRLNEDRLAERKALAKEFKEKEAKRRKYTEEALGNTDIQIAVAKQFDQRFQHLESSVWSSLKQWQHLFCAFRLVHPVIQQHITGARPALVGKDEPVGMLWNWPAVQHHIDHKHWVEAGNKRSEHVQRVATEMMELYEEK